MRNQHAPIIIVFDPELLLGDLYDCDLPFADGLGILRFPLTTASHFSTSLQENRLKPEKG
jgi:hypothetical protein